MSKKEQCLWLGSSRGLDNHPAFRQRCVVCFYLPNAPAKKKSQEEIGSAERKGQSRENGAQISKLSWLQSISKAWEAGMTHPCSQVWPRCWGHRAPWEETKWGHGHPATPTAGGNNLVLAQGQHCRCSDGSLRWWPKTVPWGDVPRPGNQAIVGPKGTSQPRLLGLRCWREEQLKLESHSDNSKKSKNSPQKNASVTGKSLLCPPLLILSCKDAVPCREP